MTSSNSSSFASNMISIYSFILVIFVLIVCIIITTGNNAKSIYKNSTPILIFFSFVFFIYLLGFNIKLTENKLICGSTNTNVGFMATIFPYIFIYSLGIILIHIFEGWKRSFSNTFGLTICRMCGFNIQKYMTPPGKDGLQNSTTQSKSREIENIYTTIYENPDVFINEIVLDKNEPNLLDENQIPEYIKNRIQHENQDKNFYDELVQFIVLKDTVGTYIWVGLLSVLTILVSQNTLLNENCSKPINNNDEFKQYVSNQLKS